MTWTLSCSPPSTPPSGPLHEVVVVPLLAPRGTSLGASPPVEANGLQGGLRVGFLGRSSH